MKERPAYPTREAATRAFAAHVSRGKAEIMDALCAPAGGALVIGAREGARFADAYTGRWYWNCHSNGGVYNLGHRHPAVVSAVKGALDHVDVGNAHLVSDARAHLAARLAETTGGRLPGVVFGVSGGEAIDVAVKAARARTGRQKIVSAIGGYHGHTGFALAAGDASYRAPYGPNLAGFVQVPWNDLAALEREVDDDTAAVLFETIPATLGMTMPAPGFHAAAAEIARRRGALYVLDEVQTGLGRTGTFWAFEEDDVVPDVIVTGKGLSGGVYPITATIMTPEVHAFFDDNPFIHVSTFGGSELGCAAAEAMLDVTLADGFLARVRAVAERFRRGFEGMPFELRQRGAFMGLKLPNPWDGMAALQKLLAGGVWAVTANHDTSVVQFLPPLVLTDDEADAIVDAVRRALS